MLEVNYRVGKLLIELRWRDSLAHYRRVNNSFISRVAFHRRRSDWDSNSVQSVCRICARVVWRGRLSVQHHHHHRRRARNNGIDSRFSSSRSPPLKRSTWRRFVSLRARPSPLPPPRIVMDDRGRSPSTCLASVKRPVESWKMYVFSHGRPRRQCFGGGYRKLAM